MQANSPHARCSHDTHELVGERGPADRGITTLVQCRQMCLLHSGPAEEREERVAIANASHHDATSAGTAYVQRTCPTLYPAFMMHCHIATVIRLLICTACQADTGPQARAMLQQQIIQGKLDRNWKRMRWKGLPTLDECHGHTKQA